MAYTWEEVMLGIDVRQEASQKEKERIAIEEKQAKESEKAGLWSLGLSVLGAAVGGPLGYTIGKQLGKKGADEGWFGGDYSDWEEDVANLEEGKFYTGEARKYKKGKEKEIKKEDTGQWIDLATDLASMYLMGGGLEKGPTNLTTFGGGKGEWTVFGQGDTTSLTDIYKTGGFKGMGEAVGKVGRAPTLGNLYTAWLAGKEEEEVAPAGSTMGYFKERS